MPGGNSLGILSDVIAWVRGECGYCCTYIEFPRNAVCIMCIWSSYSMIERQRRPAMFA